MYVFFGDIQTCVEQQKNLAEKWSFLKRKETNEREPLRYDAGNTEHVIKSRYIVVCALNAYT